MTKNQINEGEQLVPSNYLVSKLDTAIDFSFIYPIVEPLYSTLGRPSIDHVEEAEHLCPQYEIKSIYGKRKETIERIFADTKEKHGM
jgi:hypothetical protein